MDRQESINNSQNKSNSENISEHHTTPPSTARSRWAPRPNPQKHTSLLEKPKWSELLSRPSVSAPNDGFDTTQTNASASHAKQEYSDQKDQTNVEKSGASIRADRRRLMKEYDKKIHGSTQKNAESGTLAQKERDAYRFYLQQQSAASDKRVAQREAVAAQQRAKTLRKWELENEVQKKQSASASHNNEVFVSISDVIKTQKEPQGTKKVVAAAAPNVVATRETIAPAKSQVKRVSHVTNSWVKPIEQKKQQKAGPNEEKIETSNVAPAAATIDKPKGSAARAVAALLSSTRHTARIVTQSSSVRHLAAAEKKLVDQTAAKAIFISDILATASTAGVKNKSISTVKQINAVGAGQTRAKAHAAAVKEAITSTGDIGSKRKKERPVRKAKGLTEMKKRVIRARRSAVVERVEEFQKLLTKAVKIATSVRDEAHKQLYPYSAGSSTERNDTGHDVDDTWIDDDSSSAEDDERAIKKANCQTNPMPENGDPPVELNPPEPRRDETLSKNNKSQSLLYLSLSSCFSWKTCEAVELAQRVLKELGNDQKKLLNLQKQVVEAYDKQDKELMMERKQRVGMMIARITTQTNLAAVGKAVGLLKKEINAFTPPTPGFPTEKSHEYSGSAAVAEKGRKTVDGDQTLLRTAVAETATQEVATEERSPVADLTDSDEEVGKTENIVSILRNIGQTYQHSGDNPSRNMGKNDRKIGQQWIPACFPSLTRNLTYTNTDTCYDLTAPDETGSNGVRCHKINQNFIHRFGAHPHAAIIDTRPYNPNQHKGGNKKNGNKKENCASKTTGETITNINKENKDQCEGTQHHHVKNTLANSAGKGDSNHRKTTGLNINAPSFVPPHLNSSYEQTNQSNQKETVNINEAENAVVRDTEIDASAVASVQQKLQSNNTLTTPYNYRLIRDYVTNMLTKPLDKATVTLFQKLSEIQHKLRQSLSLKYKSKLRFVCGFRETIKNLSRALLRSGIDLNAAKEELEDKNVVVDRKHRLKLVVLAPDVEPVPGPKGLDDSVARVIDMCNVAGVPYYFALNRTAMGHAFKKFNQKVAVVGVLSAEGAYEECKAAVALAREAKDEYHRCLHNLMPKKNQADME